MKYLLYMFWGVALLASIASCSEGKIEAYSGIKSGLCIQMVRSTDIYGNPYLYRDSISLSFAEMLETTRYMTDRIIISTIGNMTDYDRQFVIKAVEDETTAIEGEDYTLDLPQNDFTIKAGQAKDTVYVRFLRTVKLRTKTLRLKLGIRENEYFQIPFDTYKNAPSWDKDGPLNSATAFLFIYDEKYQEPSFWSKSMIPFFGIFTPAMYLEVNKVTGWTKTDWNSAGMSGSKIVYGRLDFAARSVQADLQEMADKGTPVLNDDGTYLQLPDAYQVDYSHIGSKQ